MYLIRVIINSLNYELRHAAPGKQKCAFARRFYASRVLPVTADSFSFRAKQNTFTPKKKK